MSDAARRPELASTEGRNLVSRLVELSEAEHALAATGSVEDLVAVQADLGDVIAALPETLDAGDRTLLVQVFGLREQTIQVLRQARDEAAAEIARLDHGRATVRAYVPAGVVPGRSIDQAA